MGSNSSSTLILAADCLIDGQGTLTPTNQLRDCLSRAQAKVQAFKMSSIQDGWETPLPKNILRRACSPMSVMMEAQRLFERIGADAVIFSGRDRIKSDFKDKKSERDQLMKVYGGKYTFLEAYNQLAHEFLKHWKMTSEEFRSLAEALFENHFEVWRNSHQVAERPGQKFFEPVTDLFRWVDCANPHVDFDGCLILGTPEIAEKCGLNPEECLQIIGCHIEQSGDDAIASISKIVPYEHLRVAFERTCQQAGVNFRKEYLSGNALLEVYTCYPVVPIAFLVKSGLVPSIKEIPNFLKKYRITVTGGLNLAKAPWNNTTLQALAVLVARMKEKGAPPLAGIHSIASIGYQQAFAILRKNSKEGSS